jgi:hypothetical protein
MSKWNMDAIKLLYGAQTDTTLSPTISRRSFGKSQIRKPRRNIERGIQIRLVAWILGQVVDGEAMEVIMIGNEGRRSRFGGQIAKQMGLRPGATDLLIPYVRGGYGAYWLELKQPGETPKAHQYEFMAKMRRLGYKAEWFDNWELARDSILEYMGNGGI